MTTVSAKRPRTANNTESRAPDTYWKNPQFVIKLDEEDDNPDDGEKGCTLIVGLMQKYKRRMRRMGEDLEYMGFAIYEVRHAG